MSQQWSILHQGQKLKRTTGSAFPTIEAGLNEDLVAVLFCEVTCHSGTSHEYRAQDRGSNVLAVTGSGTISASSIRLPDGSATKASLRLMASSLNGSVTIFTPRALRSATAFSISGTLMQKW